jgi:hypothetical protein
MLQTQSGDVCALSESILPMFRFGQNSGHCVARRGETQHALSAAAAKLRTAEKRVLFLCIARFFLSFCFAEHGAQEEAAALSACENNTRRVEKAILAAEQWARGVNT